MVVMPKLTEENQQLKRKEVCRDCEHNKLGICTKCGCVIKLKVKFEQNQCPLRKW